MFGNIHCLCGRFMRLTETEPATSVSGRRQGYACVCGRRAQIWSRAGVDDEPVTGHIIDRDGERIPLTNRDGEWVPATTPKPRERVTVQFVPPPHLRAEILQRSSRLGHTGHNYIARRDLERYYVLLRDELATVALSEAEAALLCDACNGLLTEPAEAYRLLYAQIGDAIGLEGLAEKWRVDAQALLGKIRSWSPAQTMAVLDAIERFWALEQTEEPLAERLRRVGLLR